MKYKIILSVLTLLLVFPVVTFAAETSIKIYPEDDGINLLYDNEGFTNWTLARLYTGSLFRAPMNDFDQIVVRSDIGSGFYRIYRGNVRFDTSVIPQDAVIKSASLNVHKGYSNNEGDTGIVFTKHTRANNFAIVKDDWQLPRYGEEISRGYLQNQTYNSFPLNQIGLSYINKIGYTDMGVMTEFDFDNHPNDSFYENAAFYSVNATGTSTDPYIEIVYSIPTAINNAPVLSPIGNQIVTENNTLSFTVSATDPDNNTLTYSAVNLPSGASFDPQTHVFTWTPTYAQSGNYHNIEFTVTDNGSPMQLAVELITITVGDVNRAPEITGPGSQVVLEGDPLSFTISASDPDGDNVSVSASNLPDGAVFTNGVFIWTPTLAQAGVYSPTFTATDTGAPMGSTSIGVIITVGDSPTPTEQTQVLIETIVDYAFPHSVTNTYLANLQKVIPFIEQGLVQAAQNQLQAFITKVDQDYTKGKVTLMERDVLRAAANAILLSIQ